MTLLRHAEDDVRGRTAVASGIDYIVKNHDLRRCDDWDIDDVWGCSTGCRGSPARSSTRGTRSRRSAPR
jgi:hypothetical protein